MKLAYMYATPDVRHSNVTAIQGDMYEVLSLIKDTGYLGVEFLVRDPREIEQSKLREIIEKLNLDVPAICTGEVYGEDKLSFADPDESIRTEAIKRMKSSMHLAKDYGAMVNIGRIRGRYVEGVPPEQTLSWIAEAIEECALEYPDVPILLEPVNHQYANCLLNAQETLGFVEDLKIPSLGIMLDVVHMLVEGEKISKTINLVKSYFWHFHISDSDRLPPGQGEYDLQIIMDILATSGFDKYVTVESFQKPNSMLALEESYAVLKNYFGK